LYANNGKNANSNGVEQKQGFKKFYNRGAKQKCNQHGKHNSVKNIDIVQPRHRSVAYHTIAQRAAANGCNKTKKNCPENVEFLFGSSQSAAHCKGKCANVIENCYDGLFGHGFEKNTNAKIVNNEQ